MNENIDSDIEKVQLSGKDKEEQKNNLITLDEILKSKPEKENENKKEKKKTESSLLSEEKISDDKEKKEEDKKVVEISKDKISASSLEKPKNLIVGKEETKEPPKKINNLKSPNELKKNQEKKKISKAPKKLEKKIKI